VVPTLRGKVEFEVSEEGREDDVLIHLSRRAVAETFRAHLGGIDLSGLVEWFDEGNALDTGDLVPAAEFLNQLGPDAGLGRIVTALEGDAGESPGVAAACVELALEGLWLTRRIDKDSTGSITTYGASG
jgi:magnesium chelatase subunit I